MSEVLGIFVFFNKESVWKYGQNVNFLLQF